MRLVTLVLVMLCMVFAAYAGPTDVLIVGFDSNGSTGLKAAIEADPFFGTVDVNSTSTANYPSVATMDGYGGVITWNNFFFQGTEAVDYGDNLADYIDNGGHVSVTCWSSAQIEGRFADDATYNPVNGGSNNHGPCDLGTVYEPTHALMDGVTTITGINWKQVGTVETTATLVCDNSVGEWLGVVNASNTVSAINMVPSDGASWSGDGFQFFVNSLKCNIIAPTDFNLLTPADGTTIPVIDKTSDDSISKTKAKATEDVDFTWEASTSIGPGTITYSWECDDDPAFASVDYSASGLASTTHTETFSVTADETWYWRVTAIEDDMNASQVSNDDFEFEFDWSSNIESASLGEIKAEFK